MNSNEVDSQAVIATIATQTVVPEGQRCQEAVLPAKYKMPNATIVALPGGYKYPPELEWIKSTGTDDCPHLAVGMGVLSLLATGEEGRVGYVCAGHKNGELPTVTLEEIEKRMKINTNEVVVQPGFQVSGIVGVVREHSTPIYTDFFEPDSHGHVPTVYLAPDEVKQLGVKQGDAVYLIFDAEFETAVVSKEDSEPVIGTVANQFGTMLKTRPKAPSKFNPNGPGVFGFNACAICGTHVDINGVDRDNRKHFENPNRCAGFAQAQLEKIKTWFSKIENERGRRVLFAGENSEYARNAMLSTIQNEDVRQEYENINETLLLWLPKKREAESKIDEAIREFVAQHPIPND